MHRLHYLDNLRIFLSILVVLHHVGVGYGTMGGWCYITPESMSGPVQMILSGLFGVEALFSMSLFFFISAYLTTHSLEKKGARKFISTQFIRLLIPLLFVMILFAPSLLYLIEQYNRTTQLSWLSYLMQQNFNSPTTSHTWFILVLITFELIYVFYWKFIRPGFSISNHISDSVPSHSAIALLIVTCSLLTIGLRLYYPIGKNFIGLQFANFVPYVFMYALGILVKRKKWLDALSVKVATTWFKLSLIVALLFCVLVFQVMVNPRLLNNYINGLHWESVVLAFIESIICFGFSGFFINFFREKFDYTNPVLSKMTENRYGVYIFHSAIVVGITMMLEHVSFVPTAKFFIASLLSVLFSFLFVNLIRNIQVVKRII